jgi:hypothetical protein
MLCRFPGGNSEHPAEVDWVLNTTLACHADPRVSRLHHWHLNDTPVTMSRNRAILTAIQQGIDIVLMVDSDMGPDQIDPSKAFWQRALDFMARRWHEAPTIIAAPYCGPPPVENIYIFRWRNYQSDHPNPDYKLAQFTREEAAERTGIEPVAALPTGVIAIDMRIFTGFEVGGEAVKLPPPWFYYEWTDEYATEKASTEDVTFTRDVSILFNAHGLDAVFVDWDTWAVHFKQKGVGKPAVLKPHKLARLFKERSADMSHQNGNQPDRSEWVKGVIEEVELATSDFVTELAEGEADEDRQGQPQ